MTHEKPLVTINIFRMDKIRNRDDAREGGGERVGGTKEFFVERDCFHVCEETGSRRNSRKRVMTWPKQSEKTRH